MSKIILSKNTVAGEVSIPPERYRAYLRKEIEGFAPEIYCGAFQPWLNLHTGSTLGAVIEDYYKLQELKTMKERLTEKRFNIISRQDKALILAFDDKVKELGYDYGGTIGSGFGWGSYMIVYSKIGIKAKQVVARFYILESGIVLRLYFSNIDKHRAYIESTPPHIKNVFTGDHGNCNHCENGHRKDGFCKFRKIYTIDGRNYEKCNGVVFEFWQPDMEKLPDYIDLLTEFYAEKRKIYQRT